MWVRECIAGHSVCHFSSCKKICQDVQTSQTVWAGFGPTRIKFQEFPDAIWIRFIYSSEPVSFHRVPFSKTTYFALTCDLWSLC